MSTGAGEAAEPLDLPAPGRPGSEALHQGMNACLVYEDPAEAIRLGAPFLAAGIAAGERCVHVVGEHDLCAIRQELAAAGIDVDAACERGQLVFLTQWEVSFPDGQFDPVAMIGFVRDSIAQARRDGCSGLRVLAEMTWALQMGVGANRLIQYEALGCHLYPDEPLVALCMYDRGRFPAEVCQDALRTHPFVLLNDEVRENVFFEPPGVVLDGPAASARVDWMLGQLERLQTAERERLAHLRAEATLQSRTELLAVVAHDLRNPISAIRSQVQLLRRRLGRGALEPEALSDALQSIDVTASQLVSQVQELRDLAVFEAGAPLQLARELVDLCSLAEEIVTAWRIRADGHVVRLQLPEETVIARVDRTRVRRALSNLLDNAVKYSPPGSEVLLSVAREGADAVLSVRDRGVGIPEADLPHVFERFRRAANVRESVEGTGLGLVAVRQIAEAHGGSVQVESAEGRGSTFTLRLPLSPA